MCSACHVSRSLQRLDGFQKADAVRRKLEKRRGGASPPPAVCVDSTNVCFNNTADARRPYRLQCCLCPLTGGALKVSYGQRVRGLGIRVRDVGFGSPTSYGVERLGARG